MRFAVMFWKTNELMISAALDILSFVSLFCVFSRNCFFLANAQSGGIECSSWTSALFGSSARSPQQAYVENAFCGNATTVQLGHLASRHASLFGGCVLPFRLVCCVLSYRAWLWGEG